MVGLGKCRPRCYKNKGEGSFFLSEAAHLAGLRATHIVSCKRARTPPVRYFSDVGNESIEIDDGEVVPYTLCDDNLQQVCLQYEHRNRVPLVESKSAVTLSSLLPLLRGDSMPTRTGYSLIHGKFVSRSVNMELVGTILGLIVLREKLSGLGDA